MRKPKPGPKPSAKRGSISGKDARSQAIEAAKIAAKRNEGKIAVRIDYRSEILIDPEWKNCLIFLAMKLRFQKKEIRCFETGMVLKERSVSIARTWSERTFILRFTTSASIEATRTELVQITVSIGRLANFLRNESNDPIPDQRWRPSRDHNQGENTSPRRSQGSRWVNQRKPRNHRRICE